MSTKAEGKRPMAHKEEDNESDQVILRRLKKDADDAAQVIGRLIETRHRLASSRPTP